MAAPLGPSRPHCGRAPAAVCQPFPAQLSALPAAGPRPRSAVATAVPLPYRTHVGHARACRRAVRCRVASTEPQTGAGDAGDSEEPGEDWVPSAEEQKRMDALAGVLVDRLQDISAAEFSAGRGWDDLTGVEASPEEAEDVEGEGMRRVHRPPQRRGLKSRDAKQIPLEALPKLAIVGRPNVGKSALFNRITKTAMAIVYDYPGVTRDRLYTRAFWGDREFCVIDTGGLVSDAEALARGEFVGQPNTADQLPAAIEKQAAAAIEEADAVVLVVDGQAGLNGADEEVIAWLRKYQPNLPVSLAVNKCENPAKADIQAADFWNTGLEPIPVSAISGTGTGELMDSVVKNLPVQPNVDDIEEEPDRICMAIIGRPNVGKSSLLNALCGEERSIVSPVSGTTRDAIDTDVTLPDGRTFKLVDTAGIRRRSAVAASRDGAEPISVDRALQAVRRCDVAVMVVDATEGITQQDFRLAEYIAAEGRAAVIVVNKWDAVVDKTSKTLDEYRENVLSQLRPIAWANVVFTSAKTGQRVPKVMDAVQAAGEQHRYRVSTATLNMVLQEATTWRQPPTARGSGRKGRIYYATQAATRPPSFVLFVNDPQLFNDDYKRYVERQFRDNIGFPGTPIRLFWRGKAGQLRAL